MLKMRAGLALLLMAGLVACSAFNEPPHTATPPPTRTPEGQTPEQAERVARRRPDQGSERASACAT